MNQATPTKQRATGNGNYRQSTFIPSPTTPDFNIGMVMVHEKN